MATLAKLVRSQNLAITTRHTQWLQKYGSNIQYSDKAIELAHKVFKQEVGGARSRTTSFRSSSSDQCMRRQVYRAINAQSSADIDDALANIFATGNFMHLKWQMMGLTEGWLTDAEVPAESPEYDFGGTADGIVWDDSVFEFKSINSRGYSRVSTYGPTQSHIRQAHGYLWLLGKSVASFVYEDKGTGEWREFRVERDEVIIDEIKTNLLTMKEHVASETLPPILSGCIDKEGYEYRGCPYKEICVGGKE